MLMSWWIKIWTCYRTGWKEGKAKMGRRGIRSGGVLGTCVPRTRPITMEGQPARNLILTAAQNPGQTSACDEMSKEQR